METTAPLSPTERRALESWEANAAAWTEAVRGRAIASRAVSDEAILGVIGQVPAGPVLDVGCGEGWLARRLDEAGDQVTGIDGSPALIARAKELGGGDFRVLSYAEIVENPRLLRGGPFGTAVFNFSLLDEKITRILDAVGHTLFPYGRVLIQTLHPAFACGDAPYRDGWRSERFPGLGFPEPIDFYFRTFSTWMLELRRAGLILVETYEPLGEDGRPVSLIIHATIPERRKG